MNRHQRLAWYFLLSLLTSLDASSAAGASESSAEIVRPTHSTGNCPKMNLNARKIWSKTGLEDFLTTQILDQYSELGSVDWYCLTEAFKAVSPQASVKYYSKVGADEHEIYRFTIDRSSNFWAALMSFGPGNSNGKFTAIFTIKKTGEISIIQRGGKPKWLKLE
ncbi:hypothetical protein [Ascidiaceihabitans sp.]|uniref:hypothetical protein n=1 Tax=Ascidiaceihabitans sp. TaxID=1872644 RepID=UPI003296D07C